MTDIIQDANRLLEGTTSAPWITGGKDESGNVYVGNPSEDGNLVATSGVCDAFLVAAAPELAQALAEETYEYAVQFKNEESGKWYTNGFYGIGMHGQKWFASKEEAEQQIKRAYPADLAEPREHRIVRRRISAPEVINE